MAALAEAPLLLGLMAIAIMAHSFTLGGMARWALSRDLMHFSAVHALAVAALALTTLAETGRLPVDNPATHLELTMIHEAMVLEYSGPSLALVEWAASLKLTLMLTVLIAVFLPWGMAAQSGGVGWAVALAVLLVKLAAFGTGIALLESSVAKMRMYEVPSFLGLASALALLAVAFTALVK